MQNWLTNLWYRVYLFIPFYKYEMNSVISDNLSGFTVYSLSTLLNMKLTTQSPSVPSPRSPAGGQWGRWRTGPPLTVSPRPRWAPRHGWRTSQSSWSRAFSTWCESNHWTANWAAHLAICHIRGGSRAQDDGVHQHLVQESLLLLG